MSTKTMVEFYHGALCMPYEVQARKQGYTLGSDAELMQELGNGIVINHIHGILTDSVYDKACQKLHKKMLSRLKKWEG